MAVARRDQRAAIEAIFTTRPGGRRIDSLYLEGVEEDLHIRTPDWPALASDLWFRSLIEMDEGYDAMLARLSSNARHGVRRIRKKIVKSHDIDLVTLTDLADIEGGFQRFLDVDARSWKKDSRQPPGRRSGSVREHALFVPPHGP